MSSSGLAKNITNANVVEVPFEEVDNDFPFGQSVSLSFDLVSKKYDLSDAPRRPNRCKPKECPEITDESIEIGLSQMKENKTIDWKEVKEDLDL